MPRRTAEEAARTRHTILESAIRLSAVVGYEGLSLERVAADAFVTRGAVYHHFGSKDGLFQEVVRALLSQMAFSIEAAAAAKPDTWGGLEAGCEAFLRESQRPEYQRAILIDGPSALGTKAWQELDDEYTTSSLVEVLTELTEAHRVSIPDPAAAAVALAGAMNQLSRWIAEGNPIAVALETLWRLLGALRAS